MPDSARARIPWSPAFWMLFVLTGLAIWGFTSNRVAAQEQSLPSIPLHYGFFTTQFAADGTFTLDGEGMTFKGTWKRTGAIVEIGGPVAGQDCRNPARYTFSVTGPRVSLEVVGDDTCVMRRMILDRSSWLPVGENEVVPERKIVRTASGAAAALPTAAPETGSWPSFRGPH